MRSFRPFTRVLATTAVAGHAGLQGGDRQGPVPSRRKGRLSANQLTFRRAQRLSVGPRPSSRIPAARDAAARDRRAAHGGMTALRRTRTVWVYRRDHGRLRAIFHAASDGHSHGRRGSSPRRPGGLRLSPPGPRRESDHDHHLEHRSTQPPPSRRRAHRPAGDWPAGRVIPFCVGSGSDTGVAGAGQ